MVLLSVSFSSTRICRGIRRPSGYATFSGGNAPDVSVKVQELADGELLITPAALTGKKSEVKLVEPKVATPTVAKEPLKQLKSLESSDIEISSPSETPLIFDIPVTYNDRVRVWVRC